MGFTFVLIVRLRGCLLILFLSSAAGRSISITDSYRDTQTSTDNLTKASVSSSEVRELLLPKASTPALSHRWSWQAGATPLTPPHANRHAGRPTLGASRPAAVVGRGLLGGSSPAGNTGAEARAFKVRQGPRTFDKYATAARSPKAAPGSRNRIKAWTREAKRDATVITPAFQGSHQRVSLLRMESKEEDDEIEAARVKLENLVRSGSESSPASGEGFRFANEQPATPDVKVIDDISWGVDQIAQVAKQTSGLLILLLEICVGGLTSPVGLAAVVLFGLLYATGDFASLAPSGVEGNYYTPYVLDESGVLQ